MADITDSQGVTQQKGGFVLPQAVDAKGPTQGERELSARVREWFREAWEADSDYREQAEEAFAFVKSEQWEEATRAKLERERRPVLTINRIKKQVQLIVGFEKQNRFDTVTRPRGPEATDSELANLMSDLLKYVSDVGQIGFEESSSFKEGIIAGRGWLMPSINYVEDPINGVPRVEYEPWRNVVKDPASKKYTLEDAHYCIRHRWLSPFQVKAVYPKKAGQIDDAVKMGVEQAETNDALYMDKDGSRMRVMECWYKKPRQITYMVDEVAGTFTEFQGTPETKVKLEALRNPDTDEPAVRFIDRTVHDIKVAVTLGVGGIVLEDKPTPYKKSPINRMLPFIPFFAERCDGEDVGLVRDLKDPQRETNKRRSQLLHMLNVSAVPGWKGDSGAVTNPAAFEEQVTRPGFVIWKNPNRDLDRLDAIDPPEAFFKLDVESKQDFFDIGINPDLLGLESKADSGRAIILRQQQGQLVLGTYFDNWKRTKQMVGIWLVGMIQQTFTDRKALRITGMQGEDKLIRINEANVGGFGEVANIVTPIQGGEEKIIGDFRDIHFDIVVTESPSAPTTRLAQLAIITDLMNAGAFENPALADFILDLSGFDPEVRNRITSALGQAAEVPTNEPPTQA